MKKIVFLWIVVVPLLCACMPRQDNSDGSSPTGVKEGIQYLNAEALRQNAMVWARQEFARLSAAELIYRHIVVEHEAINPVTMEVNYALNKMYRELTHWEIDDIYRSESYLYPVTVKLRFDYKLFATTSRIKNSPNDLLLAQKDTTFRKLDAYSVFRWYRCDNEARHIGKLPPILPRPRLENIRYFEHEEGAGLLNPYPPGEAPRTYPRRLLRPFN